MHTGFSPPDTAGNTTTESSGSHTAVQPPHKVRAMASALDQLANVSNKPGIRCAVAVPAVRREIIQPDAEQAAPDVGTGGISIHASHSEPAISVAESGSSQRLVAAAELVRRKKQLARLEVEEMEIEAELAAVRSARGSQTSSVRLRSLGNLAQLPPCSPESLQSKMRRLQDSEAMPDGIPTLPAVPEHHGVDLEPRATPENVGTLIHDDLQPRASEIPLTGGVGTQNIFVQNTVQNDVSMHVDQSFNVAQQANFAIAQLHHEAAVNQVRVEHIAELHVTNTLQHAAARCEEIQHQANNQQLLAEHANAGMQNQVHGAMTTIAQLQARQAALEQKLLDAEVVRTSEVKRAYQEGELAASSKPGRRTDTTSIGATTPQIYNIGSPVGSIADAAQGPALATMIADAVSSAVSAAMNLTNRVPDQPAAAGGTGVSKGVPAAAGTTSYPTLTDSLPAAAGEVERPSGLPPTTCVVIETTRPAGLPRSSSLPELTTGDDFTDDVEWLKKRGTTTLAGTGTTRTATTKTETASSSRGRSRRREDSPEEKPPPKKSSPPRGGGSGGKRGGHGGDGDGGDGDDGSDSSSSGSSFGSAHSARSNKSTALLKRIARRDRVKENAEVKVPNLPSANQFRAWKHTVYQNVNAASGRRDDKALEWIRECERIDALPAEFRDCPKTLRHTRPKTCVCAVQVRHR